MAEREQRFLITEDRDLGEIVFRRRLPHAGVLYLRLPPLELEAKIFRLQALLDRYDDRLNQFIVVTESAVRVRTST
ncbi:MAG: DUF5615 family PIN-like protein [Dehalococcoidia bacterium]|nr:DUF5615 family PIN-like protein [Dehalococcoidia bacterium]